MGHKWSGCCREWVEDGEDDEVLRSKNTCRVATTFDVCVQQVVVVCGEEDRQHPHDLTTHAHKCTYLSLCPLRLDVALIHDLDGLVVSLVVDHLVHAREPALPSAHQATDQTRNRGPCASRANRQTSPSAPVPSASCTERAGMQNVIRHASGSAFDQDASARRLARRQARGCQTTSYHRRSLLTDTSPTPPRRQQQTTT